MAVKFEIIIPIILESSKTDMVLSELLENVREYAHIYRLARQRQKGCDSIGEVATLKDEFKGVLDEMIQYCKNKGYISNDIICDADEIVDEFFKDK